VYTRNKSGIILFLYSALSQDASNIVAAIIGSDEIKHYSSNS